MKIDVSYIIAEHARSLNDGNSFSEKALDVLAIYLLPVAIGGLAAAICVSVDNGFYGISISVFAIFSALLLNTQIAIFGIYGRDADRPKNDKERIAAERNQEVKRQLIRDLNTNISYLMIFSVLALFACCIFFVFSIPTQIETFVIFAAYIHFSVVVVIVIKRAHALFANEYQP